MSSMTKNQEFHLEAGDLLVLYTDGLVEARDIRGHFFTLDRFVSEVERVGLLPVSHICSHLIDTVRAWMSSQQDDLTLIVHDTSVSDEPASEPNRAKIALLRRN